MASILDLFKADRIIFDLCDDKPLYATLNNNKRQYKLQKKYLNITFRKSNIDIVSAYKLKEKYKYNCKNQIIVAPNGHNIDLDKNKVKEIPSDIILLKRPIVGFIGTLFKFIDDDLLEFIINKRPQYSFVFVGKTESNFPIEKIKKFKHVHVLGSKPKDTIGNYISSFDVCINPFRKHEVNDSVNPLKVYEYLAFKKKVVSSYMYSLMNEKISDYITFANSKDSFLEQLDSIIKSDDLENKIPDSVLSAYHWDQIFANLINEIKDLHNLDLNKT